MGKDFPTSQKAKGKEKKKRLKNHTNENFFYINKNASKLKHSASEGRMYTTFPWKF